MNPLCPDPSFPVWDPIAEGCMSAARHVTESNYPPMFVMFAITATIVICVLRWVDVD